jgi:hypothetical protein
VREELRTGLLAFGAVALIAASAAFAAAPTNLEQWTPAGAHLVKRESGSCSSSSLVDARKDAWRCRSGGETLDPCFTSGAAVVCPDGTPDSGDAFRVRLTQPLPAVAASRAGDALLTPPWVIMTAGGSYCYRLAGTKTRYQCAGSSLLVGSPDRTNPVWTISLLPTGTAKRAVTTAIAVAWW